MGGFIGYKVKKGKPNIVVLTVLLAFLGVSAFLLIRELGGFYPEAEAGKAGASAAAGKIRRKIDGVFVARGKENNPLYAVVIDNMIAARPFSGLAKASLVYEAPVEGGITRLLAIFDSGSNLKEIGPIRSARPYFIDFAGEFGALFTHVGGSPEAMERLDSENFNFKNLDLYFTDRFFWRDKKRSAPHNVYTSSKFLADAASAYKLAAPSYDGWKFKADRAPEYRPEKNEVTISAVQSEYTVRWVYNKLRNSYDRYNGKKLVRDKDGGIVQAKNVIVLKTDIEIVDAITRRHIRTEGEGKATIFMDGRVNEAKWIRADRSARLKFFKTDGGEFTFNAGPTWIEIVSI